MVADEDDFGFDALGEEETVEAATGRLRRRLGPPANGRFRALVRLVAVLAATIAVIVVLVSVFGGSDRRAQTRGYLEGLSAPAADSQAVGQQLERLLGGSAVGESELEAKLGSLIQRQQQDAVRLQRLMAVPRLYVLQQHAKDAFALRLVGLQGILSTLRTTAGAKETALAANVLAALEQRLVTSDVVWDDLVRTPLLDLASHEHLAASLVPRSSFVGNAGLVSPTQTALLLQRLRGLLPGATTPVGTIIKLGDHGKAVAAWQSQLNAWLRKTSPSSKPLTTDGVFGAGTQAATEALQRSAGITADGTVGPATRRALKNALAKQA